MRVPLWARAAESARSRRSETASAAGGPVAQPVEPTAGEVAKRTDEAAEPSSTGTPVDPVADPVTWTLFGFSRRESASVTAKDISTLAAPAGQRTTESTLGITALPEPTVTWPPVDFTGEPSTVSNVFSSVFQFVGDVGTALHVDLTLPLTRLLTSARPPRWTTVGLSVKRSEFDGMRVWTLQSSDPSGKYVVGVHGGGVLQPVIFNWLDYASIARDTGATVIVPLYPLVRHGGTAATIVPDMADLIAAQIDQRGADNVSVYGDSAGGQMLFPAVQELVRRGSPVPYRMVLSSPVVDATFTDPAVPLVDDAIFRGIVLSDLHKIALRYADGLDLADPLVSALYGSLAGLPPTTVYAGSRDIVAPGIVALQAKAAATGADFTFVLRKGEPHDWAIVTLFPEVKAGRPYLYQQLGIISAPR